MEFTLPVYLPDFPEVVQGISVLKDAIFYSNSLNLLMILSSRQALGIPYFKMKAPIP
jgi:hypothetical protein